MKEREKIVNDIFLKPGMDWTEEDKLLAYNYFTERYMDYLINTAFGYMKKGVKDKNKAYELAKDVVAKKLDEDAFVRYRHTYNPRKYKYFNGYNGEKAFCNWVFVMVIRYAVEVSKGVHNALQKQLKIAIQTRERNPIKNLIVNSWDDVKNNIDSHAIKDLAYMPWEEIVPYLPELSKKHQEALELIQKQGLSQRDAAKKSKWQCLEGAMKLRLYRARQELYNLIKEESKKEYYERYLDDLPKEARQAYILIIKRKKMTVEAASIAGCTEEEIEKRLQQAQSLLKKWADADKQRS